MAFLIYDCVGIERLQIVNTSGLSFFLLFVSVRFFLFLSFGVLFCNTHKHLHKRDSTRIGWMNMLGCCTQTERGRMSHTHIYGSIISTKSNGVAMMKMTHEYLIWSECRFDDEDTAKEESKRFTITRNSTGKLANLSFDFIFRIRLNSFFDYCNRA